MSLFNPDPDAPVWVMSMPLDSDLADATPEQREQWVRLNAQVAYIYSAWSNLEFHLACLFAAVLRITLAQGQVVLATLTSNRTKRDLIANCSNVTLRSAKNRKLVESVLGKTAKLASTRNWLAHGTALHHQKFPDRLTVNGISPDLRPALSNYRSFALDDLEHIRQELLELAGEIGRIIPVIWKAKREPSLQTPLQGFDQDTVLFSNRRQPPREKLQSQPQSSVRKSRPRKLSSAQKRKAREAAEKGRNGES